MPRLIFADLIANARIWLGAFVVILATAFVAAVAAGFIATGNAAGGEAQIGFGSIGGVVIAFTSIAALIVVSSVANLTVALQQRAYALWQLVGMRPALVGWVVIGQLLIVAVAGSLAGCLVATPFLPSIARTLFTTWEAIGRVPMRFDGAAVAWVTVGIVAVALLSGSRGARRAARVPPIEALREPDPPRMRAGWLRWIVALAALGGVTAICLPLRDESFTAISSEALILTPLFSAPLAALGPLLFPAALRAWSALVPGQMSASWFLARHSAAYRLNQSSAAIGPLMVAISLAGGLYTATLIVAEAGHARGIDGNYSIPWRGAVIILGGPLLLSGLAAAATVFMSGRAREREFALIQSAGATNPAIATMSVWEAVIYAATAAVLAAVTMLAGAAVLASALAVPLTVAVAPAAGVAGGGLVLLLAATLLPALATLRRSVPRSLAAE
ncbi:MAG TPA: FtsX-like permease family protein [Gryllotalpicola sp.]